MNLGVAYRAPQQEKSNGRALVVQNCVTCHRMYWPDEFPPPAWEDIVQNMAGRAGLSSAQSRDMTEYFIAASKWAEKAEAAEATEEDVPETEAEPAEAASPEAEASEPD